MCPVRSAVWAYCVLLWYYGQASSEGYIAIIQPKREIENDVCASSLHLIFIVHFLSLETAWCFCEGIRCRMAMLDGRESRLTGV